MRLRIVAFAMLLMLCLTTAANADQWFGPFLADGIGMTERSGAKNANQTLDKIVLSWAESLKPGQEAMVVISEVNWDKPIYSIEFWIVVIDSDSST